MDVFYGKKPADFGPGDGRRLVLAHWRLGLHLAFRTRRFGVNNEWWSAWPSPWGLPLPRLLLNAVLVLPLLRQIKMMKTRMSHGHGWVPAAAYEDVFGARRLYVNKGAGR